MTSNELFRGLLAAVSARKQELPGDHDAIHRAFFQVLQEVRRPEVQERLELEDLIEIDFDPLYGQSNWFDRALTRAQRDQIISFPNPSYDTIRIRYDENARSRILNRLGSAPTITIRHLAEIFVNHLEQASTGS
jgi:hypothetical protein